MTDYYEQLDVLERAGREYADNCIAAGDMIPDDAPFSGAWADGLTPQDALDMAGINARYADMEDFEQADVIDYWESGYFGAPWPSTYDEDVTD